MSIRALLRAGTFGSLFVALLVVILIVSLGYSMRTSLHARDAADKLEKNVFDLIILTSDFVMFRFEGTRDEWQSHYAALGQKIDAVTENDVLDPQQLTELREHYVALETVFRDLSELEPWRAMNDTATLVDNRLMTTMLTRARQMEAVATRMRAESVAKFDEILTISWIVAIVAAIAFAIAVTVLWLFAFRRMDEPLAEIEKGISAIGEGEFRQQIRVRRNDEMGQIATALNALSDTLSQTMVSRNQLLWEIERRNTYEKEILGLNTRLAKAIADLGRSNQELEEFAYVASHDLQEPLRAVSSYARLLKRRYKGQIDDKADHFLSQTLEGCDRMQRMVDDLLMYSRISSRWTPPTPAKSLDALSAALSNLDTKISASGAVISHGDLPIVLANFDALIRLFQNFIDNAIKYRSEESPTIYVNAERLGDKWRFSIRDNGIGIDPSYHQRIFSIFQRLHTRTAYEGTGIGLAICRRIVDRHGGEITVESQEGEGASFHFTLPAVRDNGEQIKQEEAAT